MQNKFLNIVLILCCCILLVSIFKFYVDLKSDKAVQKSIYLIGGQDFMCNKVNGQIINDYCYADNSIKSYHHIYNCNFGKIGLGGDTETFKLTPHESWMLSFRFGCKYLRTDYYMEQTQWTIIQ